MAEEALEQAGAAASPAGIKQEQDPTGLEDLGFNMSPGTATKRPRDGAAEGDHDLEAKRPKTKTENGEVEEDLLQDDLALLVQNALSSAGDLAGHFGGEGGLPAATSDPMEIDGASALEAFLEPVTFLSAPEKYVRNANLHALGNLSMSLLLILLQQPSNETIKLVRDTESNHGRSYRKLKQSFQAIRQIYSTNPILSANGLELHDTESRKLIEFANLAQAGSWLAEGGLGPLSDADTNFLLLLESPLSELSPAMSDLYLAIKTHKAVESLLAKDSERSTDEVVEEALMQGLEQKLLTQHGGPELTPADQAFISSVKAIKEALRVELQANADTAALKDKYPAEDLLRSFGTYAKPRLAAESELGEKFGVSVLLNEEANESDPMLDDAGNDDLDLDDLSSFFEKTTSGLVQNALAGLTEEDQAAAPTIENGQVDANNDAPKAESAIAHTNGRTDFMNDYKELEALVEESTSNYVKTTLHGLSPVPYQPVVPTSTTESMAAQLPYLQQLQQQHHQQHAHHPHYSYAHQTPDPPQQPLESEENLPPNQTFSSSILYDKARQAALSKSSAHTRREGIHSTRRPWTPEEEKALMAGLDIAKGPHWSQILTLFGQGGGISDILKDRTQVQLKDKARNLKLFFLKTNSEMPYYLQAVTGELKTRAPTQAARKEAEERARLTSEEDQAKVQGIMTLAGGLQHPPQGRSTGSPATAVGQSVVTPAQAAQAASTGQQQQQQHQGAAGQGQMGRPAAVQAAQARPGVQATSQQTLQAMPQAPPRPQSQLHPQNVRPLQQQQYQSPHAQHPQHQQPQHQHPQHQQPRQPQPQPQPQQHQQHQHPQHQQTQPQQPQHQPQHQQASQTHQPQHSPPAQQPAPTPPQPTHQGQSFTHSPAGQPQNARQSPATSATATPTQPHHTPPNPSTSTPAPAAQPNGTSGQVVAATTTTTTTTQAPAGKMTLAMEPPMSQEATQHNDNAAEAALLEGLQAAVAQTTS